MFVEWLRSSYRGRWRFWSDAPEQSVPGRYYFVQADEWGVPLVPAFPGPTLLTSQRWWDKNFILSQPDLGEVMTRYQPWDNGAPPFPRPSAIVVGSPPCLADGESISSGLPLTSAERFRSWPLACYVQIPLDDWGWAANVFRCEVQSWWADRAIELSAGEWGILTATMLQRFPGADVQVWEGNRHFPPMMTVVHPLYMIAQFAETQNAEQALIEVIQGVQGPGNVGGFGTTQLWLQQAMRGLLRLSERGGHSGLPVLFVGYSYGGAAALCASAIMRLNWPNNVIRFLTFGAPRPGDAKLQSLLDLPTRGVALANDNDAITAIPPDLETVLPAQSIVGRNLLPFVRWKPPRETWKLRANGDVVRNAYPTLSTEEVVDLLELVWNTGTLFGYPAHNIREYKRRLALRCPQAVAIAGGIVGLGIRGLGGIGLEAPPARTTKGIGLRPQLVATGKVGLQAGLRPPTRLLGIGAPKIAAGRLGLRPPAFKGSLGLSFVPPRAIPIGYWTNTVAGPTAIAIDLPQSFPGSFIPPGWIAVYLATDNPNFFSSTWTDSGGSTIAFVADSLAVYHLPEWTLYLLMFPAAGGPGLLDYDNGGEHANMLLLAYALGAVDPTIVATDDLVGAASQPSTLAPYPGFALVPALTVACMFAVSPTYEDFEPVYPLTGQNVFPQYCGLVGAIPGFYSGLAVGSGGTIESFTEEAQILWGSTVGLTWGLMVSTWNPG